MNKSASIVLLLCICFASGLKADDWLETSPGGSVSGKVKKSKELFIVQTDDDLMIAIPEHRVRGKIADSSLEAYRQAAQKAGRDAELNHMLAKWCRQAKNLPQRASVYHEMHLKRAVAADPDLSAAWSSMGYVSTDNGWVPKVEWMRSRGMVNEGGKWKIPETVADERNADLVEVQTKQWIRKLTRMLSRIEKGGTPGQEALAELRAIDDPMAINSISSAFKKGIGKSKGGYSRGVRLELQKKLIADKSSIATQALVLSGLEDDDGIVREASLEALTTYPYGSSSAVATYMPILRAARGGKVNNNLINRAARALSWFPDPELAEEYVEALVTKHSRIVAPGAGMNVGFGGSGGGGMSTGGKAVKIDERKRNPAVLALLKMVEPDADYGYDKQAWKLYLAAKRNPSLGDIRRDL